MCQMDKKIVELNLVYKMKGLDLCFQTFYDLNDPKGKEFENYILTAFSILTEEEVLVLYYSILSKNDEYVSNYRNLDYLNFLLTIKTNNLESVINLDHFKKYINLTKN